MLIHRMNMLEQVHPASTNTARKTRAPITPREKYFVLQSRQHIQRSEYQSELETLSRPRDFSTK